MFRQMRVIKTDSHPPLLTRDDLLAIIEIEDQFGGRSIGRLLTDWHHQQKQSLVKMTDTLKISVSDLQRWMYWLHIEVIEIVKSVDERVDKVAMAKADQNGFVRDSNHPDRFVHGPTGLVISIEIKKAIDQSCMEKSCTLAELCREPHYWPLMLCNMSDEAYGIPKGIYEVFIKLYRGTLGKLAGAGEHTTDKEDVLPTLDRQTAGPDEVQHPSGITLTPESHDSLKRYCLDLDCTMEELFTELFDPARIADTANEIGIGASVYLKLWQYYTAQAKPKAETTGG